MALSKIAQQFADEIRLQDWMDAHIRRDRAGHNRERDSHSSPADKVLDDWQTESVRMNVMWVTAQVLGYNDPNFDVYEYAQACGVNVLKAHGGRDGTIAAGLRNYYGPYQRPGTYAYDSLAEVITTATSDAFHASTNCRLFRNGYQGAPILKFARDKVPGQWKPCQCVTAIES